MISANYDTSAQTASKSGQSPLSKMLLAPPDLYKPNTPAATKPAGTAKTYTGQSTFQQPRFIGINQTEDAANNVMALGYQQADQRYQTKQLDRAGFSRGKGQQFMAQQQGAQELSKAAGQAAEVRSQDMKANAQMQSDYEKAREMEAQSYAMSQHAMSQADWARQFAHQQNAASLMEALLAQAQTPQAQLAAWMNQGPRFQKK